MIGILGRLNISRWAVWGQVEHRKVWRSIPHTVVVSVWTSIRRISAPHAKHFIAAPRHPIADGAHGGLKCAQSVVTPYRLGCWGAVRSQGGSLPALRRTARLTIERVRRAMPRNPDVMALCDLLDQLIPVTNPPSRNPPILSRHASK